MPEGEEDSSRARTSGPSPGHPAAGDINNSSSPANEVLQGPDIRPHALDIRLLRKPRKSGLSPGHPTPPIQRAQNASTPARTSGPQPGHPARPEGPDIWPDARTSGSTCLRTVKGPKPMYLFAPIDYIYSIPFLFLGLAKD